MQPPVLPGRRGGRCRHRDLRRREEDVWSAPVSSDNQIAMTPNDQRVIEEALSRDDVPWAYVARGQGDRAAMVDELVAFFRQETLFAENAEARLDQFVREVGGRRTRIIDPWAWLARLVGRATGRRDVYEFPASWVENVGLPPLPRPGRGSAASGK